MTPFLLTLALLRAGDATSTAYQLSHGFREGHPLFSQSIPINLAEQAVVTTAQTWALQKLSHQHPRLAKTLAGIGIGIESVVVVHNMRQGR